jgi:hypothetical protein
MVATFAAAVFSIGPTQDPPPARGATAGTGGAEPALAGRNHSLSVAASLLGDHRLVAARTAASLRPEPSAGGRGES